MYNTNELLKLAAFLDNVSNFMEKINISNICVILNNYFIHYCDSNVCLFFIGIERAKRAITFKESNQEK